MVEFLLSLNWKAIAEGVLSNLIPTAIAGGIGYVLVNQMVKQVRISQKMKSYGFKSVDTEKNHTIQDIKRICKDVQELDMIYVSGYGFFKYNEIPLKAAMDRGMKIRFLCAKQNSQFLWDIEKLEIRKGLRKPNQPTISDEIDEIIKLYSHYLRSGRMDLRFYTSEYRLPFMLSHRTEKNKMITQAWLTITLPPYKAVRNFVLSGEKNFEEIDESELNFVQMMEEHFEYVWGKADKYAVVEDLDEN